MQDSIDFGCSVVCFVDSLINFFDGFDLFV